MSTTDAAPRDDIQTTNTETRDRIITAFVTGLPVVGLIAAGVQLWNSALHVSDLIVFTLMYFSTGFGITVGFHRLLTHRSFKCHPAVRFTLAALGSAAIEGPVISWVADHRKHHAFSDQHGDPHSPHVDHGHGWKGALRGAWHAHVGWIFVHTQRGLHTRYAPDLLADPIVARVNRTFLVWALGGLFLPFGLGWLIGGSLDTALTGMLWGGPVRVFVLHHVTYSINSLCHLFGRRDYTTDDQSRNLAWLAVPSMGEAWHNNHHAFPTSARHGLRWWQFDLSALVISALTKLGLAWDVVAIAPDRQAERRAS